ncbi:uridine kinase [Fragilaria crotonensis]|nr:uridine kinase [Fragilaria crotonensis]
MDDKSAITNTVPVQSQEPHKKERNLFSQSLSKRAHAFIIVYLLLLPTKAAAFVMPMDATYDKLASQFYPYLEDPDCQHWVAIAGGPGSGKTTTAVSIAERLNAIKPNSCVVLPVDGFHYSKARLMELDPSGEFLRRRGAPWTFDAELCMELLCKAKKEKSGSFPVYDRTISDPVNDGVVLTPEHKVVLIEGLYLLLQNDARWKPLQTLWDERWFVKAPTFEIQRQRLIERSLRTWSAEKAEMWGQGESGATARVDANDTKNMSIVAACEEFADTIVVTL